MGSLLAFLSFLTISALVFIFFSKDGEGKETRQRPEKNSPADLNLPHSHLPAGQTGARERGEFEKLSAKLKKAKEDYQRIEEELSLAKKNEAAREEELQKLKSWMEKGRGQDEANKKEMNGLKEKLSKKDKEFDEYRENAENLKAQNNDQAASLRLQAAQIKAYREEVKNLTQA